VLLLVGLISIGCSTATSDPGSPKVMVAVRLPGGSSPSPEQVSHIHQVLTPSLVRAGFTYAVDPSQADYIVSVTFTPDALSPERGHIHVHGVEKRRATYSAASDGAMGAMKDRGRELERWAERRSAPEYVPDKP
jgi:hypothetical protein